MSHKSKGALDSKPIDSRELSYEHSPIDGVALLFVGSDEPPRIIWVVRWSDVAGAKP